MYIGLEDLDRKSFKHWHVLGPQTSLIDVKISLIIGFSELKIFVMLFRLVNVSHAIEFWHI